MSNPLNLYFLVLTEAGTGYKIRVRADLFAGVREASRGKVEVYTELKGDDGASRVFVVSEDVDYIMSCLREMMKDAKASEKLK